MAQQQQEDVADNNYYLDYIAKLTTQCQTMREVIVNTQHENRCLVLSNQSYHNAFFMVHSHIKTLDKDLAKSIKQILLNHLVLPEKWKQVDKERIEEITALRLQVKTAHGNQTRVLHDLTQTTENLKFDLTNMQREIDTLHEKPGCHERRLKASKCMKVANTLIFQVNANKVFADLQTAKAENSHLLAENKFLKRELATERGTLPNKLHMQHTNGVFEGRRQMLEECDMTEHIRRAFLKGEVKGRREAHDEAKTRDAAKAIDDLLAAAAKTPKQALSYAGAL